MKKLLLGIMAVSMIALSSCKKDVVIPSLDGTAWNVTYDFDPATPPTGDGTALFLFKSNGTFESGIYGGTWTQDGSDVTFAFTSGGTAAYSGTIDGDTMSGAIATPAGTWKAVRY